MSRKGRKKKKQARSRSRQSPTTPRQDMQLMASQRDRLRIQASFDSSQTTTDNTNHWSYADSLSADAAGQLGIRQTLRNRARYEVANNCYARGILQTVANDMVGDGPIIQMNTDDDDFNKEVERAFNDHMLSIDMAGKLRTARITRGESGEAFALFVDNPKLGGTQLDMVLRESDYFSDPAPEEIDPDIDDGIRYDQWGNPESYQLLRSHPGALSFHGSGLEADTIPAEFVAHWYRVDRPGQRRGLPDIMPALPLFSQLRRYTLAVIAAAETAADFAAVIQSNEPADSGAELTTLDTFELERRMATVLPEGYQLGQIKAEQPTTTYGDFKKEIITEIARCLSVPYNVAAGDSSKYNYASGRLDHQVYWKMLDVERSEVELKILKPFFRLWLQLFLAERSGIAPQDIDVTQYVCAFFWPGREHVDPKKEADAQSIKLKNGTTNLQREQGKMGYDYETEMRQTQKEALLKMEFELQMVAAKKKLMQSLGLTPEDIEPDPKKPKPPEKDGRSRKTAGVAVSA